MTITWSLRLFDITQLTDYAKNPRSLSKEQYNQLKTSLDKFGLIDKPIVNADEAHTVIGGHQRLHVLRADGVKAVECWYPSRELTAREVEELNIRLNKATGAWDFDILANQWELGDLLEWGFSEKELQLGGFDLDEPQGEDPGAQVDKAEELRVKWGVELGQLWKLGEHRLICGDCTDRTVVERVMGGEKAGAVVTDSPYGINRGGIENDTPEGLRELFDGCLEVMPIENGVIINFQSPRLFPEWIDATRAHGHKFERALWFYDETDVTFPWRGWLMTSQIALVTSIGKPKWSEGEYHHDCYLVKTAGKQDDSGGHTTAKPLDVVEDLVKHTTGDVYEPFSGSGTTLIACERLSRKCRAVEISPAYVSVALERFYVMTGILPELMDLK